ncbi:MAG: serine/threonine-protein kinase [Planctomycetota bacterium]
MNTSDLDRLLADCLERMDRGEQLDADSLIGQYPQHADQLRAFLVGNAQLEKVGQTGGTADRSGSNRAAGDYMAGDEIHGRYRLLQLIGEGGMGSVWLAQQSTPVKRRVAIKLIRAGMDSKLVLARFDAERQALAMMDHPNIARVYDGGMTERGRPFFVMEYLRGTPLTDYCDQARLSVHERMDLFLQVCRAIQHAHTKGIVHRDLKPSNILVCLYDGRAVPKVIDFGLAKALNQDLTDLTLHTAHGVMVGTPIYMSPEQAELNNLDVDTRTDVYSLGVVLYELLTGTTPLDRERLRRAAIMEVLRLIREEDPIPPSTRLSSSEKLPLIAAQRNVDPTGLRNSVTGDLDWIVMKAIEKERTRRYETVVGLAEDIQRFLTDDIVQARPPGLLYRLGRRIRRHRVRWMISGAVLAGALAAAVGLSWGWKQSTQASTQVQQSISQMQSERMEKQRALEAEEQQRLAADQFLAEGILRSFVGETGYEDSFGISRTVSAAEQAALQVWSGLKDDNQRIRVLEIGLADADSAQQLAARPLSVLRACVGMSTVRRQRVLELLAKKQRCSDCAPEIRAVCCLLTADLGGTDLDALADIKTLTVPTLGFQKRVWRLLPSLPPADQERLLDFLLIHDDTTQSAALHMQFGEDQVLLEDGVKASAKMLWKRILNDMQKTVAALKTDTGNGVPRIANEELLVPIAKSLPESAVSEAVNQLLDLIEGRPSQVSRLTITLMLPPDLVRLLLLRLPAADAAVVTQRLTSELNSDADGDRMSVAAPYISVLLSKLSAADINACRKQLFSMVPRTENWQSGFRWQLAELLEQCVSSLPPGDLQPIIGEVLMLTEQGRQPVALEVLSPTMVRLTPLMTQDQVIELWTDSVSAIRTGGNAKDSEWWMMVMTEPLLAMANRLDDSRAATAATELMLIPEETGRPLVTMPAVMTAIAVLLEHLNSDQLARVKRDLMTPLNPNTKAEDPVAQEAAVNHRKSVAFLLEQTYRTADPGMDKEFLQWLQTIRTDDENFWAIAEIAAPTLDLILSRTDKTQIPAAFDSLLTSLRQVDWKEAVQARETAIRASALLSAFTRHMDAADKPKAWSVLLELLKPAGDPVQHVSLRDGNYSLLIAPALRELAFQIPEDQCERDLQELVLILHLEDPNIGIITPRDDSLSLFCGVTEPLAGKLSASAARSLITWLNQNDRIAGDNIRSLALQAVMPRLDERQTPIVWDELYAQSLIPGSPEIGAIPFRDLALRLTPEQAETRWNTILEDMRTTDDTIMPGRLAGILITLLPHASSDMKKNAVDPLIRSLQIASRALQVPDSSGGPPKIYDDRSEQAVRVLAEQLDAADHDRLADACLQLMLQFPSLTFSTNGNQLQLVSISRNPRQIARYLCHPVAPATMQEKLLRRFEELVLRDGRSLDPSDEKRSPFSDQYGMNPDDEKIETIDALVKRTLQEDTGRETLPAPIKGPRYFRRRFMTIFDAAEWIQKNWPDFHPDRVAAEFSGSPASGFDAPAPTRQL